MMTDMMYKDIQTGIGIRPLTPLDAEELCNMMTVSREHHAPFEPIRGDLFYTPTEQLNRIIDRQKQAEHDQGYYFGVFELQTNQLVGHVSLSNVSRGVAQYADMGYFTHASHMGKGYMSAAVKLVLHYAFYELHLHRVQASILVHNVASRRVLEKNGFQAEGIARQYLLISGKWQDHQIYAAIHPEWKD
ncbi:GNAT family protein [Paenibacillus sp. Marseille-Q4541]|uniref:GNAT family N-acetyltransferase n=1 Tax=Paenibacillus sp. Marseille-Q4541 TaxID=2831522 RepID=UPI0020198F34|nr:GNAT family protein [Paenibacillus sp. Marseille-Q4541]